MAGFARSEFIDFTVPLRERLTKVYDGKRSPSDQPQNDAIRHKDPARAVPQGFIDAMVVREAVFVKEQGVPLEHEFDDDDPRSFHWTAYASIPMKASMNSTSSDVRAQDGDSSKRTSPNGRQSQDLSSRLSSTKIPIGTIRVTPKSLCELQHVKGLSFNTQNNEAYAQIGRLAVVKEFRKAGIGKLLVDTALERIRHHPYDIIPQYQASALESIGEPSSNFNGLLLVHSQTGVEKVWRRYGFEKDESMGAWLEEGIKHSGMWKRVDVSAGRRKSKVLLPGRP